MRMGLERMPGEASGEKGGGHWGGLSLANCSPATDH